MAGHEYAFMGNLFLSVLAYFFAGSLVFYGKFLVREDLRKELLANFRKRYWRKRGTKLSIKNAFYSVLTLACLLFFLKIVFYCLEPSVISVF